MTDDHDDPGLDDLFRQVRATPPLPSPALLRQVMDDALRLAPQAAPVVPPAASPQRRLARALAAALGAGGFVTGMAAAAAAGVWIGLAQPAPVAAVEAQIRSGTDEGPALIPSFDEVWSEDADG